jgi:YD repeat-containing protein
MWVSRTHTNGERTTVSVSDACENTSGQTVVSVEVSWVGQRIRKTNVQGDTVYHYDAQGRLIAESSPTGQIQKEYIYLGDTPVGVIQ